MRLTKWQCFCLNLLGVYEEETQFCLPANGIGFDESNGTNQKAHLCTTRNVYSRSFSFPMEMSFANFSLSSISLSSALLSCVCVSGEKWQCHRLHLKMLSISLLEMCKFGIFHGKLFEPLSIQLHLMKSLHIKFKCLGSVEATTFREKKY